MKIQSEEIPQADTLEDVIKTVVCVSNGGERFQDIARAIGKVERQGRYYRKAAEILGFIESVGKNHSALTDLGRNFLDAGLNLDNQILIDSVFSARIFQRIIPYFEIRKNNGVTKNEIIEFILDVSDITKDSMAPRRVSSVVSWLESLGIIYKSGDKYFLSTQKINQKVPILEFTDISEPLLPKSNDMREYEAVDMRVKKARADIVIYQDSAAMDRADNAHRRLVNLVADRIKNSGSIPRYNKFIDLATKHVDQDYIFEMKSITEDNAKSQIRTGLSQLYEYRYLQNLPNAKLVLVIEKPLPKKNNWLLEYLEKDRDISLIWDGNDNLFGSAKAKENLQFLRIV